MYGVFIFPCAFDAYSPFLCELYASRELKKRCIWKQVLLIKIIAIYDDS